MICFRLRSIALATAASGSGGDSPRSSRVIPTRTWRPRGTLNVAAPLVPGRHGCFARAHMHNLRPRLSLPIDPETATGATGSGVWLTLGHRAGTKEIRVTTLMRLRALGPSAERPGRPRAPAGPVDERTRLREIELQQLGGPIDRALIIEASCPISSRIRWPGSLGSLCNRRWSSSLNGSSFDPAGARR
jgi:hypothetical protein